MDHGGQQRLKPGVRWCKYISFIKHLETEFVRDHFILIKQLKIYLLIRKNINKNKSSLVNSQVCNTDYTRKETVRVRPYPDNTHRCDHCQVLGGRVERRCCCCSSEEYERGEAMKCWVGRKDQSWSLQCLETGYCVWHSNREIELSFPASSVFEFWCMLTILQGHSSSTKFLTAI